MNKFKVGDRARIIRGAGIYPLLGFENGEFVTIKSGGHISDWKICGDDNIRIGFVNSCDIDLPVPQWNGRVTVNDVEYRIDWNHVRFDLSPQTYDVEDNGEDHKIKAMTYCFVSYADPRVEHLESTPGIGHALCSMSDNFCRKMGRKVSLERALQEAFGSSEERRQVWEQVLQYPGLVK